MIIKTKIIGSFIKYTVAAIIISITLFPKFPFLEVPGTFVSVRLEDFVLAFSGILLVLKIYPNLNVFIKNKLVKVILILLCAGLLSVISGVLVTKTVIPHIGFLHWLRRIEYFVPLFLGIVAVRSDKSNLAFFARIFVIVLFVIFFYGVGQKYLHWPIIITQNQEYSKGVALRYVPGGHINSTFAGHYDLGTFLIIILPVLVSAFFTIKEKYTKLFLSLSIFSGLWLLVNTASRISLVSYLISVVFALIFINRNKMIPLVLIISLVFTLFSENLITRYERIFNVAKDRVERLMSFSDTFNVVYASENINLPVKNSKISTPTPTLIFEDRSTNIRLNVEWPRATRSFLKNPLLGTGYSSITLATDNDYLRLLGEMGFVGFIAFIMVLIRIVVIILQKYPFVNNLNGIELSFVAGMLGSLPGVLINALFIDVFEASKFAIMFWLMIGFVLGIAEKHEY